eukprot:1194311-Pleurochrysis_carterae.AAC.3
MGYVIDASVGRLAEVLDDLCHKQNSCGGRRTDFNGRINYRAPFCIYKCSWTKLKVSAIALVQAHVFLKSTVVSRLY